MSVSTQSKRDDSSRFFFYQKQKRVGEMARECGRPAEPSCALSGLTRPTE